MDVFAYCVIAVLVLVVSLIERREYKQMHKTLKELRESVDKLIKERG